MSHDRFQALPSMLARRLTLWRRWHHVRVLVSVLGALALSLPAAAQVVPFPGDFRTQEITTDDGATIHVRTGGQGPAVVLLHGFGDTGDMWAPLAATFARDHTVVVPDLRGMGLSSHPAAAMTSARKRPTSGPSSPIWASSGRPSSGTISAPWSPMPMPPAIPIRPRSWW